MFFNSTSCQGRIQKIFQGEAIPNREPHVCRVPTYPQFLSADWAHFIFRGPFFIFFRENHKKKIMRALQGAPWGPLFYATVVSAPEGPLSTR